MDLATTLFVAGLALAVAGAVWAARRAGSDRHPSGYGSGTGDHRLAGGTTAAGGIGATVDDNRGGTSDGGSFDGGSFGGGGFDGGGGGGGGGGS
ncbi:hypothetical protein [Jidongwangia harbinensis]|uniref:hypothetical protein n=1 Tax=Jidongwangia harbinensis TaxID=2878561 RepID=UPI001CD998CD|nr:hypothetical protein [Jidongwangia harbinensis]MCA2218521.1 hypothetical protein [Jidongwangia harbinensis]